MRGMNRRMMYCNIRPLTVIGQATLTRSIMLLSRRDIEMHSMLIKYEGEDSKHWIRM